MMNKEGLLSLLLTVLIIGALLIFPSPGFTVASQAPPDGYENGGDGGGGSGGSAGGGGGGGVGGGGPISTPSPGPNFDYQQRAPGRLQVSISDLSGNASLNVSVPSRPESTRGELTSLQIQSTSVSSIFLDINSSDKPVQEGPSLEEAGLGTSVAYFDISHSTSGGKIKEVEFRLRVDTAFIDELGQSPENVTLYRYENETWIGYETQVINEANSSYIVASTVPGLSTFSLGVRGIPPGQSLEYQSPELSSTNVVVDESVQVSVMVNNPSEITQTNEINLLIDGTIERTRKITVPSGERREVVFEVSFDSAGSHTISLDNVEVGQITIDQPESPEPTPEPIETVIGEGPASPEDGGSPAGDGGGGPVPFWTIVALLMVILFVLGYYGFGPVYEYYQRQR